MSLSKMALLTIASLIDLGSKRIGTLWSGANFVVHFAP